MSSTAEFIGTTDELVNDGLRRLDRRTAIKIGAGSTLFSLVGCANEDAPESPDGSRNDSASRDASTYRPDGRHEELLIKSGLLVTASGIEQCDLRVIGERISELGQNLSSSTADSRTIDASGLHVLPGGIDPHVHLAEPWCDDFKSGSRAALAGGITTLGHMSFPSRGQSLLQKYTEDKAGVEQSGICDFFFHLVALAPGTVDIQEMAHLVSIGQPSIKMFMLTEQFSASPVQIDDLMRAAREKGIVCLLHAEDQLTLQLAAEELTASQKDSLEYYPESRPVSAEIKAVRQAISLCNRTGATVYLVHTSCREAVWLSAQAQAADLPLFVETRPMYLHLTDEIYKRDDAALFVGMPPVRTAEDQAALWTGIDEGVIQTVATDHAPWTRAQKMEDGLTINNPRGGVNNLEVMLPMLMNEVVSGRISLETFARITATNTAQIFGMYPDKGVLAEGAYADIGIWDLNETRSVSNRGYSNAGFSIYEGASVTGWPVKTIRRGEVVFENGSVIANSGGKVVARQPRSR